MPAQPTPAEPPRAEPSLAKQSTLLTMGRVLGYVVAFLIPIILVRIFTQAEFGLYKQALLVGETVLPLLGFGLNASLFYFLPRHRPHGRQYLIQALGLLWLSGLIGGGFVAFGADWIAGWMDQPDLAAVLPFIGAYIAFSQPGDTLLYLPIIDRRPILAASLHFGNELLKMVIATSCALVFGTVLSVLMGLAALAGLRALLLMLYIQRSRIQGTKAPNWPDLRTQLAYALPFGVAVMFEIVLTKAHQFFVSSQVSAQDFAIYAAGVVQVPLAAMVSVSVAEVVLVRASSLHREGRIADMTEMWVQSLSRLCAFIVPMWIGIEFFADDLILVLFGPDYQPATPVFRIFVMASLGAIIIDHGLLRAVGDTRFLLLANVIGFLISVLVMALTPQDQLLFGAVSAYVIGYGATRLLGLARVSQRLEISMRQAFPFAAFGLALVLSVATSGLGYALTRGIDSPLLRLCLAIPSVAVLYAVLVSVTGLIPTEETRAFFGRLRR